MPRKLAYLVTEDWYFLSHRLPMARAARDAGFEVHVLTRVADGGAAIAAEGFAVHPIDWARRDGSPVRLAKAVGDVRGLLRKLRPAVLHNVALKPAIVGGLAAAGLGGLAIVNNINGLGSGFLAAGMAGTVKRLALTGGLSLLLKRQRTVTVVQNPQDYATFRAAGLAPERLRLIAGSGVDTRQLQPLPEPGDPVTTAYVGRMLADKGLTNLMAAHRLLRARGVAIRLLLAGTPDPENPTSFQTAEVEAWGREPGVEWLGHVSEISQLWARAHIAVLPSRREGLPLSLLEASACGRPMIATDVPGCRDVVADGQTGLLVPVDQPEPLAAAMARLASDTALRQRLGAAARARAVAEFSSDVIAAKIVALYRELAAVGAKSPVSTLA